MIFFTIMDYEGEPVTIENGVILEADPPKEVYHERHDKFYSDEDGDIYWDSDELDWTIDLYDFCGNDVRDYGLGWYDCNSDWRTW